MSDHDNLNKILRNTTSAVNQKDSNKKKKNSIYNIKIPKNMWSDDDKEEQGYLSSYVHWTTSDNRIFVPAAPTEKTLIPGVYEIDQSSSIGLYFEKIPVRSEGLVRFPDTNSDRVLAEIQKFWEREHVFREYNLIYKRGILLYGPPGSGKSCTVQLIMEDVVHRNGIVIKFTEPELFIDGMRVLRQIQPDTPVVVIMEDIDSDLEIYNESEILNILDGVNEVNKIVFLATTNYPEKLGARIVNRPSRFDKRFRIGFPSKTSRRIYFEHLIGGGNKEKLENKISELDLDLDLWVKDTDEMSIAHLKELFVQVVIIGDPYDKAIDTLKSMTENLQDKEYDSEIGFAAPKKSSDYYD